MESSVDSRSFAVCVSLHSVPRSNSNELRTPLLGCTCVSSSSSIEKAPADSKRRAVRTPFLLFIRTLAGFRIIQTAASFSNRQRRASASASQPCTQPGADSPRADSVPHTPRCGPAPITPDPSPGFVALLEATSKSRVACERRQRHPELSPLRTVRLRPACAPRISRPAWRSLALA